MYRTIYYYNRTTYTPTKYIFIRSRAANNTTRISQYTLPTVACAQISARRFASVYCSLTWMAHRSI